MILNKTQNIKKAFTLIELSVVIVVISIFLAGSLYFSITISDNAKIKVTNDRIEQIYNALGNYLVQKGRLPCPAAINDSKSNSSTYGIEASSDSVTYQKNCIDLYSGIEKTQNGVYSSSNLVYGMVPVINLGLSKDMAEDGFGNKFTYVVDRRFTGYNDSSDNGVPKFKNQSSSSIITVNEIFYSNTQQATSDAIFIIISHGANGYGAFKAELSSQNTRSSDSSEMSNDATSFNDTNGTASFDATFIKTVEGSDVFDDIVFYKTRNDLLKDFNVFSKVSCPAIEASSLDSNSVEYGGTYMAWSKSEYNQVVPASTDCPASYRNTVVRPIRKCGAFGIWGEVIEPCN